MKLEDNEFSIINIDPIYGFVDYGKYKFRKSNHTEYITKVRCKKCGAAWLAENYVNGFDTCPKCEVTGRHNLLFID